MCDNFGMTLVFEDCLIYFVKQLEKYMHTRRQDLMACRLGAVAFESRYIWLKMIARPSIPNHSDENRDWCLSGQGKFNKCLNELVETRSGHHIMNIQSVKDPEHYDSYG